MENNNIENSNKLDGFLTELDKKLSLSLIITIFTIFSTYNYYNLKAYISEIVPAETLNNVFEVIIGYLIHNMLFEYFFIFINLIIVIALFIMLIILCFNIYNSTYKKHIICTSLTIKFIILMFFCIFYCTANSYKNKNEFVKLYFQISVSSGVFKENNSTKVIFSYGKDNNDNIYYSELNICNIKKIKNDISNSKDLNIGSFKFIYRNISTIKFDELIKKYEKLNCIKVKENSQTFKKCIGKLNQITKEKP